MSETTYDNIKNRKRGRGKIKMVRRQKVDNLELVKELLEFKKTILEETDIKNKKLDDIKEKIKPLNEKLKELKKSTTKASKSKLEELKKEFVVVQRQYTKLNDAYEDLKVKKCFGKASERLGEIFLDLVENYATKSSFSGYTYLEEMKSRAIFFLLRYSAKSFDPEKSKNAFAYCTQIVKNAFIQVITKEKKRATSKKAYIEDYLKQLDYTKKEDDLFFS